MRNWIRTSILTLIIFAATVLFCTTAAMSLWGWLYWLSCAVFIFFNIKPSFTKRADRRVRSASDGADLLCAFLALLFLDSGYVILSAVSADGMLSERFWINVLIVFVAENIVFWNGIIRAYLAGTMIGFRWRVAGILCGMIPIANIYVLCHIIHITRCEAVMEERRFRNDAERRGKNICATKYPILMVHGVFFRDIKHLNYWGRIPAELEKNGARIYYGEQQSALSIAESGAELAKKIEHIIRETGCEKVNIIAHSKGGLDSRYAISCLGMDRYVASLTTINTPHRGCVFAEWLLDNMPESFKNRVADRYNSAFRLIGDSSPDFLRAVGDLKASSCKEFNQNAPDSENVYYQSVGSKINKPIKSVFPLNFSYLFAKHFDGPNDGLVTVESARWGENFTHLESKATDGVSHADVIDLSRHDKPDLDIREFYVGLVSGLKNKGF